MKKSKMARGWLLSCLLLAVHTSWALPDPQALLPKSLPCTLNNIALVGGDLPESDGGGGIQAKDAVECMFECERRANCQFWSHVEEWKVNCFLKEVAGEERHLDGSTTGWKGDGCRPRTTTTTTTPAPPPVAPLGNAPRIRLAQRRRQQLEQNRRQGLLDNTGCRFDNTALLGGDLPPEQNGDGVSLRSFVECRQACRDQPGCNAFTFVKEWDLNCFLKASKGDESEFLGAESGTLQQCSSKLEEEILKRRRQPQPSRRRNPFSQQQQEVPEVVTPATFVRQEEPQRRRRPPPAAVARPPARPAARPTASTGSERECLFLKTNFLGGGLSAEEGGQGIETRDQLDCSTECQKRPRCHYWTFVSKWKANCYLKSRLGEKSDFEDGVSGTYGVRCEALEHSASSSLPLLDPSTAGTFGSLTPGSPNECLFADTNFLGGGLTAEEGGQGIETKGHQECSRECQNRPRCNYWTYVEQWKVNCYLKSRLGEKSDFEGGISGTYGSACDELQPKPSQRRPTSNQASRQSAPTRVRKDGEACLYQNTNFLGGGLSESDGGQGVQSADVTACDRLCKENSRCQYWTFVEAWQVNCYLKDRLGEKTDFDGAVSGTYGSNCHVVDGTALPPPSSSSSSSSLHLGEAEGGKVADGGGCRYLSVNLQGGDLPKDDGGHGIETRDPDHCRNECADRAACQFWTFVKEWKVNCYLKDKKGPEREMEGATSGALLVACDQDLKDQLGEVGTPRDNEHECAYDGQTFNGADLPAKEGGLGIVTKTAENCRARCLESRYCKHWVHIDGWRVNCYLKGERVAPEEKEGAVSGSIGVRCLSGATTLPAGGGAGEVPRTAGSINFRPAAIVRPTNNRKDHCRYPGLNYQGGDLSDAQGGNGLEAKTPSQCAAECEQRPYCQFWTHVADWKVGCYLKSSFDSQGQKEGATSGSIGVACDEGYVAPPHEEDDEPPPAPAPVQTSPSRSGGKVPKRPNSQPDNVCFFSNVNILGGDLPRAEGGQGLNTKDVNNCAIECYRRDRCVYFVWSSSWGRRNCLLKSHFDDEEGFTGATAGSIGLDCGNQGDQR